MSLEPSAPELIWFSASVGPPGRDRLFGSTLSDRRFKLILKLPAIFLSELDIGEFAALSRPDLNWMWPTLL